MDRTHSATDIRQQMQHIRRGLQPEVDGIVDSARDLLSWKHYVTSFPWLTLGAAAALGYMVVPRKQKMLETMIPDPETLKRLAQEHRLVVEHDPAATAKPGLVAAAVSLIGSALLRAGVAYAGQNVGRVFASGHTHQEQVGSHDDRTPTEVSPTQRSSRFQRGDIEL